MGINQNRLTDRPNKNRIDSLQALRAIVFLGIFFVHARFVVNWASLGVSTFFVFSELYIKISMVFIAKKIKTR